MWRLAFAAVPLAALILARAAAGLPSLADTPLPTPTGEPSPSPSPTPAASPTPEPLPPAPEATPQPPPPDPKAYAPQPATIDPAYTGALRPGDWVQVTGTDSCLNVRSEPWLPPPPPDGQTYDNVLNCLPDGFFGWLEGSVWGDKTSLPVNADGRWWWRIVGQGWAADEFLTFHHQGDLPWPERPNLANAGLIAYLGADNGSWLMNADGTGQRNLVAAVPNEYYSGLSWSPAGDRLAFMVSRTGADPAASTVTRVVGLDGGTIAEYPGLSGAVWAPTGERLSALRVSTYGDMMGYHAVPVVLDVATGVETAIGPHGMYMTAPVWHPDAGSLAFVCVSSVNQIYQPDGTVSETRMDCGGDGLRIASADGVSAQVVLPFDAQSGVSYISPSWSPDGHTIALSSHWGNPACRGWLMFNVDTLQLGECVELPPTGGMGGRCGGPEDIAGDWSTDGSKFIYHTEFGAGRNGVFIRDVASGDTRLVPFAPAWYVTLAPDGQNLAFSGSGYIWVAGLDGSTLTLLGKGQSPAWQPLP